MASLRLPWELPLRCVRAQTAEKERAIHSPAREHGGDILGAGETRRSSLALKKWLVLVLEGKPLRHFPAQKTPVPSAAGEGMGGTETPTCKNPPNGPNALYYKR